MHNATAPSSTEKRSTGPYVTLEGPIGQKGYWYVDLHPVLVFSLIAPMLVIALILGGSFPMDSLRSVYDGIVLFLVGVAMFFSLVFGPIGLGRAVFTNKIGIVELSACVATLTMMSMYTPIR